MNFRNSFGSRLESDSIRSILKSISEFNFGTAATGRPRDRIGLFEDRDSRSHKFKLISLHYEPNDEFY